MGHFAQCFLSRVAVNFCRAFVPVSDPVVFVANNDGIFAQIQQPRLLGQTLFVALALGQIDDGGLIEQGAISRRRSDRCAAEQRRNAFTFSRLYL